MRIEWNADRRYRRHRSVALSLLPVLLVAAACGTGNDESGTSDGPRVVATTGVLADIAFLVVQGLELFRFSVI